MDTEPTSIFDTEDQEAEERAWREGEAQADAGIGVLHDEVVAWMQSWGTDHELPRPKSRCIG